MERRNFLGLAFAVAAGAAVLATAAGAAPLAPQPLVHVGVPQANPDAQPAVIGSDEVAQIRPEQVHWHGHWRHRHWGWHHRHWGWRHRHWGWHHHWHHRHWRRW